MRESDETYYKFVVDTTCEVFGIPRSDIYNHIRNRDNVYARDTVWYICYRHRGMSLNKTGSFTGHHHASVLHGARMIEQVLSMNYDYYKPLVLEVIRRVAVHDAEHMRDMDEQYARFRAVFDECFKRSGGDYNLLIQELFKNIKC